MIELFDGWKIDADYLSYCLYKETGVRTRKTGTEVRKQIRGYYGSLESALKAFGDVLIVEGLKDRLYTLREALAVVSEARSRVETLIEESVGIKKEPPLLDGSPLRF